MREEPILAVYALAQDWSKRTNKAMQDEYRRLGIGVTNELYTSIENSTTRTGDTIQLAQMFRLYGRYVDMGAGPGSPTYRVKASVAGAVAKVESRESNRRRLTEQRTMRKPKKFYSIPYYGRLNALMGLVSGKMQESALDITNELRTETN